MFAGQEGESSSEDSQWPLSEGFLPDPCLLILGKFNPFIFKEITAMKSLLPFYYLFSLCFTPFFFFFFLVSQFLLYRLLL